MSLNRENTLIDPKRLDEGSRKYEAALKQYEWITGDWKFQHQLIWQIPSVAVAIMAGILAISFTQLHSWPRIILLAIGAVLLLALTMAVVKHRFGADIRTRWIEVMEIKFGLDPFPLVTEEAKRIEGLQLTKDRLYTWIIGKNFSAEIWLIYVIFIAFILLSILAIYEALAPITRLPTF
jgi:hypothetical protein